MAINERVITGTTAAADSGAASAEQNLILRLDANDVDSYDGDGDVWYDISEHDVTIPLSDNADDLELHLNASDSTSYDPATDTTTWTDISGNGNDATLTSLTNTDHDIDNGGFFTFDGSSDLADVGNISAFNTTNSFTLEFWENRDDTAENNLASKGTYPSNAGWFFSHHATYGYYFFDYGTGSYIRAGGTYSANKWRHVVLTWNASTKTPSLFVDGESVSGTVNIGTGTGTNNTVTMQIGNGTGRAGSQQAFDGKIGVVRGYSKILSASEIGQNYRHGRDYIYTSLIDDTDLELHLDAGDSSSYSGSGSTWSDLTAGSHDVTLTSMNENQYDEEIGGWFEFDASADYGVISGSSDLYMSGAGFTIEAWVNRDDNGEGYIISSKDNTNYPYALTYHPTLGYYGWLSGSSFSGGAAVSSGTGIGNGIGKWDHVVMVQDGTDRKNRIYVNGVHKGSPSSAQSGSHSSTSDVHIGTYHNFTNKWDGKIGQIRIYDKGLTADEIMQNYLFTKNDYPNGFNADLTSLTFNSSGYFTYDSNADKAVITNGKSKGLVPNSSTDTTILMWVRIHNTSALTYILTGRNQSSSINNFYFRHYNNNLTLAIYDDGGTRDINHNFSSLSANTWYLLGFRTTTDGSARVNVITTGSSTFTDATGTMSSYESTDVDFNIGYYRTNYGFDGDIGKVSVYNKYLSDSDITAHYDEYKSDFGLS